MKALSKKLLCGAALASALSCNSLPENARVNDMRGQYGVEARAVIGELCVEDDGLNELDVLEVLEFFRKRSVQFGLISNYLKLSSFDLINEELCFYSEDWIAKLPDVEQAEARLQYAYLLNSFAVLVARRSNDEYDELVSFSLSQGLFQVNASLEMMGEGASLREFANYFRKMIQYNLGNYTIN